MQKRVLLIRCAVVLGLFGVLLMAGCAKLVEPLPTSTPLPRQTAIPTSEPSATPVTPTAEPTVRVQFVPEGLSTPVPIIYKMFDYGTDYQKDRPELGPIGSIQWVDWRRIHPERGNYNWDPIDVNLALEANLKVTLPDGREIPKPVVIQVMPYISGSSGKASFTDYTPAWVYDVIDSQNPGNPRPVVDGRKVGYALAGCGTTAVVPMYDSPTWRQAYYDMVRALGARYNSNPQVTSVVINTGLDGETQPIKDQGCPWNTYLDQQAPNVRYNFSKFIEEAMAVYREAFPDKTIYINNAPGGSGMRKFTSDLAASFDPPIGLKHSGMWVDLDSHQGYGDFYGSWDLLRAYSDTLPIWLESPFGLGSAEHRYWSLIAGLHYHPDAIDVHPEYFTQSDPAWFDFTVRHLGVTIDDTPDVWTVLRDAEFELVSWGKGGVSGFMGDWTFWLYRDETAPQSATERIWREDMPAAKDHVYSRQTRRTKQDSNNFFMSFNIDDRFPYVAQKPISVAGGNVYYRVYVTILNRGQDSFSLEYRNWDGAIVTQTQKKGPALGEVNEWVTVSFTVEDGYFNNNMPGNTDFRISCERDGDEYIHLVRVEGGWGTPPTPTLTPIATNTRAPTATPFLTSTPPVAQTPKPSPTGSLTPTPSAPLTSTPIPGAVLFEPTQDTYLDQWAPDKVQGNEIKLAARQADVRSPLLQFDVSQIPSDVVIDKAVLSLCVLDRSNPSFLNIAPYRVYRPWSEAEATWRQATVRQAWTVAGCNDPMKDRSSVPVSEIWLTEDYRWYDLDVTALVSDWVHEPQTNYGLIIKATGSASVEYNFYSSEHPQQGLRPRLVVAWHVVTPTPVPPTATQTPIPPPPTNTALPPTATLTSLPTSAPTPTETAPAAPVPSATIAITASPTTTATTAPAKVSKIVLRPGADYAGMVDTYLDEWATNKNYGDGLEMSARQGSVRVPLMRFDVTQIPADVVVQTATLRLYATSRSNSGDMAVNVAKLLRPWEATQSTWVRATGSEAWFQAGAKDIGSDRSSRIYDNQLLTNTRKWNAWDVTDLVQEWVQSPGSNYGLIMLGAGGVSVEYEFASSAWPAEDFRPYLEVEYIAGGQPPAPTATQSPTALPTAVKPTPEATSLPAQGQEVFQQGLNGYAGCEDTYVDAWFPSMNYNTSGKLIIRQGGIRSSLLHFDLQSIPQHSRIDQAVLELYITTRSGSHELPAQVYGIMRPWAAKETTFQRASTGLPWYQEGLDKRGGDIRADSTDDVTIKGSGRWVSFDVKSLVQDWVASPEINHGLVIKAQGDVAVQYDLISSDSTAYVAERPRLSVKWSPIKPTLTGTPATPTPTATATPSHTATSSPTLTPTPAATRQSFEVIYRQGRADYQGATDTYIDQWNQLAALEGDDSLGIRQNGVRLGLVHFALEPSPAGARLKSATLSLWALSRSNASELYLKAYRMNRNWDANAVTWVQSEVGVPWAGAGASGISQDRTGAPVGETAFLGQRKWAEIDVTGAVAYWLEHPDRNHGLLLSAEGGGSVEYQFASAEWQEIKFRPSLMLTFEQSTETEVVTVPATNITRWGAIAVAALVLVLVIIFGRGTKSQEPQDED